MEKKELSGGREGKIFRESETVIRPSNYWTKTVHKFLNHLEKQGVDFVPKAISFNSENEVLSFMHGEVYNSPYPKDLFSIETLKSAGKLLKLFHKYSEKFLSEFSTEDRWMLEPKKDFEVICHGDFAPYNVCINKWVATGIIDFDTIHPGPRLWDVSYAVYRWVPLTSPKNPDTVFELNEQIRRASIFLDTYGASDDEKARFVPVLIERLQKLISYMTANISNTELNFGDDIENGHLKIYQGDIEYLLKNQSEITNGILRK